MIASVTLPAESAARPGGAKELDRQTLLRAKAGDPIAFRAFVVRYERPVFAILSRLLGSGPHVEDLAQETFLKVWRALDRYDGRAPLEHWISRIAVHVALDWLRREKRRRSEVALPELGEDVLGWLRHEGDDAEIGHRQAAELLEAAMGGLSPRDRLVLTLQELEGRSVKEISALTGWSGVAVRVRALRARGRLRRALDELDRNPP
jgi:RNA polymerase sigma-70 factor (ECF subfamily)